MRGAVTEMRSALYVPAHRAPLVTKAWTAGADAVVLELEDGVPATAKAEARRAMRQALSAPVPVRAEVRVNGRGSGLLLDDLRAVAGTVASAVRLPKTESSADVELVAGVLEELGSEAEVLPILENARGIAAAHEIAAHPRVGGLLLGEEDLRADLGCDSEGLTGVRQAVVLAARAAGLPSPLQSVWTALGDPAGLRRDCEEGKRLGFRGRSVIHPAQIPVVHDVYTATESEVAWAHGLIALAETTHGGGAVLEDGTFVDDATVARARRLLAERSSAPAERR